MLSVSWLLIALPLASFFVLMLAGRRADAWAHWAGVGVSGATALIAIIAFFEMIGRSASDRAESVHLFTWFSGEELHLDAG